MERHFRELLMGENDAREARPHRELTSQEIEGLGRWAPTFDPASYDERGLTSEDEPIRDALSILRERLLARQEATQAEAAVNGHEVMAFERNAGDENWLAQRLGRSKSKGPAGDDAPEWLESQVKRLMETRMPEDQFQSDLLDLLGFEDMTLVEDLVQRYAVHKSAEPVDSGGKVGQIQTQLHREQGSERPRRPDKTAIREATQAIYPHVYSNTASGSTLDVYGHQFALPAGTLKRDEEYYEEFVVPSSKRSPERRAGEHLVKLTEMDTICQRTFAGYQSLNRVQSLVYPVAYRTNENMLVCAPTGAGKTDVALLTALHTIAHYVKPVGGPPNEAFNIEEMKDVKIIYVAPMKALAAEIVRKMSKRLSWLGIKVRELTGDMQLTHAEIKATHFVVTTPEKWDVVTRKNGGEGELASLVRLLIIDEVHLLNEDRGSVIESIVARTLRRVESSQSLIRIVGLSATLPNYIDVAEFLRVNPYQGMFFFDSGFRPVPLEQHFIGVKGKPGSQVSRTNLDKVTFEKVREMVQENHPCMVFVHARKETVKTAQTLREMAMSEGLMELFDNSVHPKYDQYKRQVAQSRNRELRELFESGFGIHNAGMLRADRTLTERLFEEGLIKVLCTTATLAWGVNLPAYAVIIKGTMVYDSKKGNFVDMSILDVVQIFGRAGRPQFEDQGVGFICTTADKLSHYVAQITQQHPVESTFVDHMVDSLNAEISLGTVANVEEAVQWLGYTFLFVRMRKNPMVYGMTPKELTDDPSLVQRRNHLVRLASQRLTAAKMVDFIDDHRYSAREQGRIASKFYISHGSIEIFNETMKPNMSETAVLAMISLSTEFEQIKVRENEQKELDKLINTALVYEIKGGPTTTQGKVNVLLQCYISRSYLEDFALVSDCAYVAQNSARILRALFEIALSHRFAQTALVLCSLCKSVEKRLWPHEHPLLQFGLKPEVQIAIGRWADEYTIAELCEMSPDKLGSLIHMNEKVGQAVLNAAHSFPSLEIDVAVRPISSSILRLDLEIKPAFDWNDKLHGSVQPFWIWLEDENEERILHCQRINARSSDLGTQDLCFYVNFPFGSASLHVRSLSEQWLGAEALETLDLRNVKLPEQYSNLAVPSLPVLPITCLKDRTVKQYCQFLGLDHLTRLQTAVFFDIYQTEKPVLCMARSLKVQIELSELALFRLFVTFPGSKALLLAPTDRAKLEMVDYWTKRGLERLGFRLHPAHLAVDRSIHTPVIVASPNDILSRSTLEKNGFPGNFRLILLFGIERVSLRHELAVMQIRHIASSTDVRTVALTKPVTSADAYGLWLGIDKLQVYPCPAELSDDQVEMHYSIHEGARRSNLLQVLAKPAYDNARLLRPTGPVLVIAPSANLAAALALELRTRAAVDFNSSVFMGSATTNGGIEGSTTTGPKDSVETVVMSELVPAGLGLVTSSMDIDLTTRIRSLWNSGKLGALVVDRHSCDWRNVGKGASHVIVAGVQYSVSVPTLQLEGSERSRRIYKPYDASELLSYQSMACLPCAQSSPNKLVVLCDQEQRDLYQQLLSEGLSAESEMSGVHGLHYEPLACAILWYLSMSETTKAGMISHTKLDLLSWLSTSFLAANLKYNPTYHVKSVDNVETNRPHISTILEYVLAKLKRCRLLLERGQEEVKCTFFGEVVAGLCLPMHTDRADSIMQFCQMMGSESFGELGRVLASYHRGKVSDTRGMSSMNAALTVLRNKIKKEKGSTDPTTSIGRISDEEMDLRDLYKIMLVASSQNIELPAELAAVFKSTLREYFTDRLQLNLRATDERPL